MSVGKAKGKIAILIKAAISVGLIVFLLSKLDIGRLAQQVATANGTLLMVSAGLAAAQFGVATLRWMAVSDALGQHLPFRRSFAVTYIGQFFNQALPSSVGGDAVRVWLLWKDGLSPMIAVGSVMLDRLAAVLGLVLTIIVVYPFLPAIQEEGSLRLAVLAVLGVSVGGLTVALSFERLSRLSSRLSSIGLLVRVSRGFKALFLSPRHAIAAVGCGVAGQVNLSLSLFVLAQALDIQIGLLPCLVLWPLVVLTTLVPLSIAGWGIREGAMIAILGLAGIPADSAILLSLLVGIISTLVSLPGGLVWLASGQRDDFNALSDKGLPPS